MSAFDPLRFTQPVNDTDGEWKKMIADAAYFLAEKRNFRPGSEIEDWLAAEEQIAMELAQRRLTNLK